MTPGSVVNIPAEVKHWHGAAPDSWFSHLAVEVPGEESSNEWCEPVSDEAYGKLKELVFVSSFRKEGEMRRKILALLMVAGMMVLGIVGCGQTGEIPNAGDQAQGNGQTE